MALDDSALLEMLRTADGGELMHRHRGQRAGLDQHA
jgi:hypothetical protein